MNEHFWRMIIVFFCGFNAGIAVARVIVRK